MHPTPVTPALGRRTGRGLKRMLGPCAVVAIALGSAGAVWFDGAGTALAPEPVHLRNELGTTQGSTAVGTYVNSGSSTRVLNWPGSYTPGSAPAGTPCSTTGLPAGSETSKVIVAYGSYRKCV